MELKKLTNKQLETLRARSINKAVFAERRGLWAVMSAAMQRLDAADRELASRNTTGR